KPPLIFTIASHFSLIFTLFGNFRCQNLFLQNAHLIVKIIYKNNKLLPNSISSHLVQNLLSNYKSRCKKYSTLGLKEAMAEPKQDDQCAQAMLAIGATSYKTQ
ncbi:MAG: hypothetical protein PV354_10580, partial [Bartonella sp.]|nr:hypothetical protein [Bartonella sp.]